MLRNIFDEGLSYSLVGQVSYSPLSSFFVSCIWLIAFLPRCMECRRDLAMRILSVCTSNAWIVIVSMDADTLRGVLTFDVIFDPQRNAVMWCSSENLLQRSSIYKNRCCLRLYRCMQRGGADQTRDGVQTVIVMPNIIASVVDRPVV